MEWLFDASSWALPVVLAITLHEAAHGWVASKFGDDTAKVLGRVTFNPIKHVDRFGTILLPALLFLMKSPVLFGYAKPVPVNFGRLQPPRLGMFMVAIAGVVVNFILALLGGLIFLVWGWSELFSEAPWVFQTVNRFIMLNCVLIAFNLLPILPLDGGRVVDSILPNGRIRAAFRRAEPVGMTVVFALLLLPPLLGYNLTMYLVVTPASWIMDQVLWLTGNSDITALYHLAG